MAKEVQKDVKVLLVLALALSLFNVISVQFYIFGADFTQMSEGKSQTIPNVETQRDSVVATSSENAGEETESNVINYVNDRLKRYGYSPIETESEPTRRIFTQTPTSPASDDQQASDSNQQSQQSKDNSASNSNTNQNSESSNQNSNQNNDQTNNQENNENDDSQQDDSDDSSDNDGTDDSGMPIVPPNEDGPPAQEIGGRVRFGVSSGLG